MRVSADDDTRPSRIGRTNRYYELLAGSPSAASSPSRTAASPPSRCCGPCATASAWSPACALMPVCSSPLRREGAERWGARASLESACRRCWSAWLTPRRRGSAFRSTGGTEEASAWSRSSQARRSGIIRASTSRSAMFWCAMSPARSSLRRSCARPAGRSARYPALVCPPLGHGGDLCRGAQAPGCGDTTPVVGQGHCANDAGSARLVLSRDPLDQRPWCSPAGSAPWRCLVPETGPHLQRRSCGGAPVPVGCRTFQHVTSDRRHHESGNCRSRPLDCDTVLLSLNGQTRAEDV